MMHEDFVAVSESLALVTRGEAITHLTEIATVAYSLDGDLVVIGETVNVDKNAAVEKLLASFVKRDA